MRTYAPGEKMDNRKHHELSMPYAVFVENDKGGKGACNLLSCYVSLSV